MNQMVELLQQMSTVQQQLQQQASASSSITTNSSNSRRCQIRTNISFYCWSHGACTHPSPECKSKKPGHQDAATFDNKMGGSTAYCQVINEPTPA